MRKHSKVVLTGVVTAIMLSGCNAPKSNYTLHASKENENAILTTSTPTPVQEEALKVEQVPKLGKEDVRGWKVTRDGNVTYQLDYQPREGKESYLYWEMTVPYKTIATVDTEAMYDLYGSIMAIDFSKPAKVKKGTDTGLQKSKTSIRILYTKGAKEAAAQNKLTLLVGSKAADGSYYCALEGVKENIFLVDSVLIDSIINQKPYSLILKLPYVINIATVSEVTIDYNKESHQMKASGDEYMFDGRKVDRKEYSDIYGKLLGLTIQKEIPEGTGLRKDQVPILSLHYKRSVENTKDCDVVIYTYDDSYCSIQVDGEAFFLVSKDEVVSLMEELTDQFWK